MVVAGAFPIAKLGALFLRQLSKPIANYAKERAKHNPFFRKYVCMPPAQFYNWCEIKARMWFLNLGKPVNIQPLNEAMAIELGANLLGEGILFVIAAGLLIYEYNRQSVKQANKEKEQEEEMSNLLRNIQDLSMQTERQEAQLRELFRHVYDLDSRVVKIPFSIGGPSQSELDSLEFRSRRSKHSDGLILEAVSYLQNNIFSENTKLLPKVSRSF